MRPDMEWRVQKPSGEMETVAKTPASPPLRGWRRIAVGLMIFLGVSLGVIYSSIPEPPKPTPTPRPTLPPVADTIEREVQALARGSLQAFMALQDPDDLRWRQSQLSRFTAWGTPASSNVYTVIESGTLPNGHVWVDLSQFRADQYFRETRFYRLRNDRWVRIKPDLTFWQETETARTAHFNLIYPRQDADQAAVVATHFEDVYQQLCQDLRCDTDTDSSFPRAITLTLIFRPDVSEAGFQGGQQITFTLPSPRITGLYFQTLYDSVPGRDEPIEREAHRYLPFLVTQVASGGTARWSKSNGGLLFAVAITQWEYIELGMMEEGFLPFRPDLLAEPDLPPLDALWNFPPNESGRIQDMVATELQAFIQFLRATYGPEAVVEFLHSLRDAQSLPQAIEVMGLPYSDFEAKWLEWVRQFPARP